MVQSGHGRLTSGIAGLDEVLNGGFIRGQAYLVRGGPGAGKTTLGMHYLAAGKARGEQALCITLGETEARLRANAAAVGLDLSGVNFVDLSPSSALLAQVQTYDFFSPAEVEAESVTKRILSRVHALKPQRVFVDALTQLRYQSQDVAAFRRQVHSFLRFLSELTTTVVFTSESGRDLYDDDLQFLSDGILDLTAGPEGRFLRVTKMRGSGPRAGAHAVRLGGQGMRVFPVLPVETTRVPPRTEAIPSGIPALDELLHGGLERGTTTIISGPSGVGKSTLGMQFMVQAAAREERAVVYSFVEGRETMLLRSDAVGQPARALVQCGALSVEEVHPAELSPLEFANAVRKAADDGATMVMLDSIGAFGMAMLAPDANNSLYSLCRYLTARGVTVLAISELRALGGELRITEAGISPVADNILFMQYLELHRQERVEVRKTVGVLKKRLTDFDKTVREIEITNQGIRVGQPMPGLQGILTGAPRWTEPRRS
ncbi:MAG: ATPase domain-containing protein [Myxococcota bacterium]